METLDEPFETLIGCFAYDLMVETEDEPNRSSSVFCAIVLGLFAGVLGEALADVEVGKSHVN
jgi:hypothetical protein